MKGDTGRKHVRQPRALPGLQRARIKTAGIFDNHLICFVYDNYGTPTGEVRVALPWDLRRTTWDGTTVGGVSYAFAGSQARTASGAVTEDQKITPDYRVADELVIGYVASGTGAELDAKAIFWVDLNLAGRAWADEPE